MLVSAIFMILSVNVGDGALSQAALHDSTQGTNAQLVRFCQLAPSLGSLPFWQGQAEFELHCLSYKFTTVNPLSSLLQQVSNCPSNRCEWLRIPCRDDKSLRTRQSNHLNRSTLFWTIMLLCHWPSFAMNSHHLPILLQHHQPSPSNHWSSPRLHMVNLAVGQRERPVHSFPLRFISSKHWNPHMTSDLNCLINHSESLTTTNRR